MDRVLQVERGHQLGDVGRIGVHLVAGVGLGRTAVPAAVVRDDPEALVEKEHHLAVPVVRAERPAVMEDDRLRVLRAPVLVEDLGAVLGGDEAHLSPPGGWSAGPRDRRRCLDWPNRAGRYWLVERIGVATRSLYQLCDYGAMTAVAAARGLTASAVHGNAASMSDDAESQKTWGGRFRGQASDLMQRDQRVDPLRQAAVARGYRRRRRRMPRCWANRASSAARTRTRS